jgi:hypothetical protein
MQVIGGWLGSLAVLAAAALTASCTESSATEPPRTSSTPGLSASVAPTSAASGDSPTPSPTPSQPPAEQAVCDAPNKPGVVLVVDPELRAGIAERLERFEQDLCAAGYFVFERRSNFATPPELRAYLADLRTRTAKRLQGAYLIGHYPFAYQWVFLKSANPKIPDVKEEVITSQYYEDVDGTFSRSASYMHPKHEYSWDVHSGNVDWELWVAVLPRFGRDQVGSSVEAINRYFDRNHAFRTGQLTLPRAFMYISELNAAATKTAYGTIKDAFTTGQYAWTPLSAQKSARIYFDSTDPPLSVDQGYDDLTQGVADITILGAHGTWLASGKLTIDWLSAHDVKTFVLWSDACATAVPDRLDHFMDVALYSPTSTLLLAKGAASDASGLGTNKNGFYGHNIAAAIAAGKTVGDGLLAHVNVPLVSPWSDAREFLLAVPILLGDPTIRLRPA